MVTVTHGYDAHMNLRRSVPTPPIGVLDAAIPHDRSGPRIARRQIQGALGGKIEPRLLGDVLLVASELVGNSVVHGRPGPDGRLELRVALDGSRVRLEAIDGGRRLRRPRRSLRSPERATGGRGLRLVDALSDRWGVRSGRPTVVWAELDLGQKARTRSAGRREFISRRGVRPRSVQPAR